jgi:cytochrome b
MNAISAHPAEASARSTVLVWDAAVRVFHWLMVVCFAGSYITSESEAWRLVHVTLGYTMAGLVAFRVIWGFVGTRHARFATFIRGPRAVARYLRTLLSRQPEHHTGHNPAGALAIVAMLALTAAIAATGWAAYNDVAGEWVAELHEGVANAMLLLVGVHLAAVVVSGWLHKENLARAMLNGRKVAAPGEGIHSAWRIVAVLLLAGVLCFWYLQWTQRPSESRQTANVLTQSGTSAKFVTNISNRLFI